VKPDASVVSQLVLECLFKQGEPLEPHIEAEGLSTRFRFHPERVRARHNAIADQLRGLPAQFHVTTGGGWSFLEACMSREGEHWGEHSNVEQLMCLGLAAGFVRYRMERKFWSALPGGFPYFVVELP
jgi:hypothetical protein